MRFVEDWDKRRVRLEALWAREVIGRPCVAFAVPRDGCPPAPQIAPAESDAERERRAYDAAFQHERNIERFSRTFFAGDAFPSHFPNFGTAGHAKYFRGCRYHFSPGTVWYDPTLADDEAPVYEGMNGMLARELQLMEALSALCKDDYLLAMPDNCGVLDALAHLRGSERLLTDMHDRPEWIDETMKTLCSGMMDGTGRIFAAAAPACDGGSAQGWMGTWSAGRHLQLQVDCSVMLSPKQFERFALPELTRLARWLDQAVYHLDGQEQIRHLPCILSVPNIRMIQWTPVDGQPKTSAFLPVLQQIQAAGRGLVLMPQKEELPALLEGLAPGGVIYNVRGVQTQAEAADVMAFVERRHRR